MAKRVSTVELQAGDNKQEFEINHAERILRMPNNGGWQLAKGSAYQFTKADGITSRKNKGANTKPKENPDNK